MCHQQQQQVFYGHAGQPVLAGTPVWERRGLLEQSFPAYVPLLIAVSTLIWGVRVVLSVVVCTCLFTVIVSISLVFCCYQQVYDIINMSCLGVIPQVRGRDGKSTPQNDAAAYSQSHIFATVVFLLPSLRFSSSWVSCYGRSSLTAEAFLWPHCL